MMADPIGHEGSPGGDDKLRRPADSCQRGEATGLQRRTVVAAALGDCVHVAGLHAVLGIARQHGWRTIMLGPAVSPERVVAAVQAERPELVALSYRLTPAAGRQVAQQFWQHAQAAGIVIAGRRFVFGGTPPVCAAVRDTGPFAALFDGSQPPVAVANLFEDGAGGILGSTPGQVAAPASFPQTLVERIAQLKPWPLIRHHFGQPTFEATRRGIEQLAMSGLVDVISLGIDQNTQEHFFHPEEKDPSQRGAGGVPVDTPDEFRQLYQASRRGHYPLMRCYSGTRDLLAMQRMLVETIHLAWAAIPLTWYSVLDGRSQRGVAETIREAQVVMRWLAERRIPVEMNESHHWSLRDAPDVVAVGMAFLAAYNAKRAGVQDYVAQYMFNTPPLTSFRMDLAKMLAKVELIESLHEPPGALPGFRSWRQTRLGLRSHPVDRDRSKGHLAASTLLQMALRPDIVHVVAYTEADHAATAAEIIESVKIAQAAMADAIDGLPDLSADPQVQERRQHLLQEVRVWLRGLSALALAMSLPENEDPFAHPQVLTEAIRLGLVDAPHLAGNPASAAAGRVVTQVVDGAYEAFDPVSGRVWSEQQRIAAILRESAPLAYRYFLAADQADAEVDRWLGLYSRPPLLREA